MNLGMSALTALLQRRSPSTITHPGVLELPSKEDNLVALLLIYFSLRLKGEKDEDDETSDYIKSQVQLHKILLDTQDYGR